MYCREAKRRECLNDGFLYCPIAEEWKQVKWKGAFSARRCHTAFMVGKHLVVQGGIDSLDNFLSDIMILNLEGCLTKGLTHKWVPLDAEGDGPGYIANHTSELILSGGRFKSIEQCGVYSSSLLSGEDDPVLFVRYPCVVRSCDPRSLRLRRTRCGRSEEHAARAKNRSEAVSMAKSYGRRSSSASSIWSHYELLR